MKKVYYIGDFMFPEKNAAGSLVLGNASLLRKLNYEVILIGNEKNYTYASFSESKKEAYGFKYFTVPHLKNLNGLRSFKKYLNSIIKELDKNKTDTEAIIFYSTPNFSMLIYFIKKWAHKNNIKVIANIADISAVSHGKIYDRFFKLIDFKIKNYLYRKKIKNLITVTDYIANKFDPDDIKNKVKIPPLVIKKSNSHFELSMNTTNDKKQFIYAGVPFPTDGRQVNISSYKDRLDKLIELFSEVKRETDNFIFDIYGLTKPEYLRVIPQHKNLLEKLEDNIFFHGNLKKNIIEEKMIKCDFTINFRDVNEMTSAGFSTKFVESLSLGIPTIMTNTSEIDSYLKENINGFLLSHSDFDKNQKKIIDIIKMENEKLTQLKINCLKENLFYFENYENNLKKFMQNLL